jgi:hypothetical protein
MQVRATVHTRYLNTEMYTVSYDRMGGVSETCTLFACNTVWCKTTVVNIVSETMSLYNVIF